MDQLNENLNLKYDTPLHINEMSREEVLALVEEQRGLPPARVRAGFFETLYKAWGYTLSNDILYFLLSEPQSQLIISTAGGGKTTNTNAKIIGEKIFRKGADGKPLKGDRILYLVYNRQNKPDVQKKHARLLYKLESTQALYRKDGNGNKVTLEMDKSLQIYTMHAFCNSWCKEYLAKLGLVGCHLITDMEEIYRYMGMAAELMYQKYDIKVRDHMSPQDLTRLYNLSKESTKSVTEIRESGQDILAGVNLSDEVIEAIFARYDKNKSNKRAYDYTDQLYKFLNLLETNAEVLKRVQSFYDYIVADEFQDFTPIMSRILQLLTANNTPLLAIGDEDQCIYEFRGADIRNVLDFTKKFKDARVYALEYNRRCRQAIFDEAVAVLQGNKLRFNKELRACKSGGVVNYIPYANAESEIQNLVTVLKTKTEEELFNSYVAYREQESSVILTELLEEACIPFHVASGYLPFSHELYRHVIDVMNALMYPTERELTLNLYKVLPVSKAAWYEDLGYDPATRRFTKNEDENGNSVRYLHFGKRQYIKGSKVSGFSEVMLNLIKISKQIDSLNMSEYFPQLFNLLRKYFWKFKSQNNQNPKLDIFIEKRVINFFNKPVVYAKLKQVLDNRTKIVNANNINCTGLTVSTFHKLKGLEFNTGYLIDLCEDIFPNFALIDARVANLQMANALKEAEARLYFVALTRAKDELNLYYREDNPSIFVKRALQQKAQGSYTKLKEYDSDTFELLEDAAEVEKSSPQSLECFSENVTEIQLENEDLVDSITEPESISLAEDLSQDIELSMFPNDINLDVLPAGESKLTFTSDAPTTGNSFMNNLLNRF